MFEEKSALRWHDVMCIEYGHKTSDVALNQSYKLVRCVHKSSACVCAI